MMNLPFKLRERTGYCTPEGPTINSARLVNFILDGSAISFSAPRHSPYIKSQEEQIPKSQYHLDDETFRDYPDEVLVKNSWKHLPIFFRSWGFYGPWFTGAQAKLSLFIDILMPTEPKAGVSFFHPRAFESAVGDFLTVRYSKDREEGQPLWIAPMNWSVLHTLPCVAARLGVHPVRETNYGGNISEHLFFPIGNQFLLHFIFTPSLLVNEYWKEREKEVDPAPVNQLLNDVIASLKVILSAEAQAQQAKALEGLTDTSLTPTFPPLKWGDDNTESSSTPYQQIQHS